MSNHQVQLLQVQVVVVLCQIQVAVVAQVLIQVVAVRRHLQAAVVAHHLVPQHHLQEEVEDLKLKNKMG